MFTCTICMRVFTAKRNLTRHMKLHSKNKETVICEQCEKPFSNHANLKSHTKTHHNNNKNEIMKCMKCSKTFSYKSNLNRHMLICNIQPSPSNESSTTCHSSVAILNNENHTFSEAELIELMDDKNFEFDIEKIPSIQTRKCYYCKKVFNRVDNCKFHQQRCRKRKYPDIISSSKKRKTQVGQGSQRGTLQLMTSALDGSVKSFRKLFHYDESAIDHMMALEEIIRDFIQRIKSESERQDIKCFFSLNLTFHQASDENDITDPAVTLRSDVFIVQSSSTDIEQKVNTAMEEIKKLIDDFEKNGSGWVLHQLQYLDLGKIYSKKIKSLCGIELEVQVSIF